MSAIAGHMRALGWFESHFFGFYFLRTIEGKNWCVDVQQEDWSLCSRIRRGEYKIVKQGTTVPELEQALEEFTKAARL